MFQNVTEEVDIEESNGIDIIPILKEIFKPQNIVIYILTFLMSTLSIRNEIVPFGLAMVAAALSGTVPVIAVFVSAGMGTLIGNGLDAFGNFFIISIIYFLLILIFKPKVAVEERNEVLKTGGRIFIAYIIVEIFKNMQGVFLMYDLFISIISGAIIYVFYKIFVNGLIVIREFKVKTAYTIEELIGTAVIFAIASLAFDKINILSLNISNIIIIFMIMVLGWKNGIMLGATAGISTGLALSLGSNANIFQICIFSVSGVLAGLLNKFGKIGVIIGFILGNCILTYVINGNVIATTYFREIFIASIGLLLVPARVKIEIEDLVGRSKLLTNIGETRLEENKEIAEKLKIISDTLFDITNSNNERIEETQEVFIQDFLDSLEEYRSNMFYEEISNEDNGIVNDVYVSIKEKEIIVENDLIEIFKIHNNYILFQDELIKNDLQEIIKVINRTYKAVQIDVIKKQERKKQIKSISKGLQDVSKVIDKCAKEITEEKENKFAKKEKEINILLQNKNISILGSKIRQAKNHKYIIELKLDYEDTKLRDKDIIIQISDILSKSISSKITFQKDKKDVENKVYYQIYSSEDKYLLQVGSAKIAKEDSKTSGDCDLQMRLEDGKYIFAISDGMGTGKDARASSKLAIKMIKNLISSGFEKDESINLINSTLNMKKAEMYSSLDVTILDLYTGNAEILKNGASNTYLKNKKNIKILKSEEIPIGIMDKVELNLQTTDVSDGDIILMCSDGILESKDEIRKDWIEEFLKNITTNNVQKIADLVLAEAIDNTYGVAKDDMTVIVIKIIKRK